MTIGSSGEANWACGEGILIHTGVAIVKESRVEAVECDKLKKDKEQKKSKSTPALRFVCAGCLMR